MAKKTNSKKASTDSVQVAKKTPAAKVSTSGSLPQTFNIDEVTALMNAVNNAGINELKLEKGDFKISIRQGVLANTVPVAAPVEAARPVAAAPVASAPAAAPVVASEAAAKNDNLITIKSPMIGTFYRSSGPGKDAFVNVGDSIKEGQVLCIVEAMKLFNEIESEMSGTIVKVLVDDASPVEYDQPLFLVEP